VQVGVNSFRKRRAEKGGTEEDGSGCFCFAHPAGPRGPRKECWGGSFWVGGTQRRVRTVQEEAGYWGEKVWVQRTPIGASIIVYWETDDPQRTLREIADSQDEVDRRFKELIENAAPALDLSEENPLSNELLFEFYRR